MFYIYKHTHRDSGRAYIGKTNDVRKRQLKHLNAAKNDSSFHYHRALRKYGENAFDTEILWEGECESEAYEQEIKLISEYDTYNNGYNMTVGGDGLGSGDKHPLYGIRRSSKTKRKISEKLQGYVYSNERNKKISNSHKGKSKSVDHRQNISMANIGKIHSGETKCKISKSNCKLWKITTPNGENVLINNLKQYCSKNNLNYYSWKSIKGNKPYRGYTREMIGG